jgi:hypothetical protein
MPLTSLLKPIFANFWWILPLIVMVAVAKTPWFKGVFGEFIVKVSARFLLDPLEYTAIHDVTLQTSDGTTQIDHIFISRYGIFVVETKNYGGWIFGDPNQAKWTQKFYKKSNQFQNPLRQNYKHIKALEELTGLAFEKFHSVIVFVGGSTFKTTMPENVTQSGAYIRYIKSKMQPSLTIEERAHAYDRILNDRLKPSMATNYAHIQNVQNRLKAKSQSRYIFQSNSESNQESERLCPNCGSPMQKRTVHSNDRIPAEYWSCSDYPKCSTIQSI